MLLFYQAGETQDNELPRGRLERFVLYLGETSLDTPMQGVRA